MRPRLADLRDPVLLLATGFGAGLSPVAPGTVGTLVGLPLYLVLAPSPAWMYWASVLVLLVAGVCLCDQAAQRLGTSDPGAVVWDEIVGLLITLGFTPPDWRWIILGFILFRLFDALKPWPVSWFDREVKGGLGIMLDDVVAALLAALPLVVIARNFA